METKMDSSMTDNSLTENETLFEQANELCEKGIEQNNNKNYSVALKYFLKAEEKFRALKNIQWIHFTLHEKLHTLWNLKKYAEAESLIQDLKKKYTLNKQLKELCLLFIHEAKFYTELDQHTKSIDLLEKAKVISQFDLNQKYLNHIYMDLGNYYLMLEHYFEAIQNIQNALTLYESQTFPTEWSWCQYIYGVSCFHIGFLDQAEKALEKAYKSYLQLEDYPHAIASMEALRKVYQTTNDIEKVESIDQAILKIHTLTYS